MAAAYQDQYIEQGTTFNTQITLDDNTGTPYDLRGFTVYSQAKRSYYSSNAVIQFTSTLYDAQNGVIQLYASNTTTSMLPTGKMVYDVIIVDGSSNVTRVLEGQIFVSPGVTNVTAIPIGSPSGTNTNEDTPT
jgi:hypothetical protein